MNTPLFGLTVYHIQHVRSETRLIRSYESHRATFCKDPKLSSLVGFGWLFGFIDLYWMGNQLLPFLAGVYIALAFVVKKNVWQ